MSVGDAAGSTSSPPAAVACVTKDGTSTSWSRLSAGGGVKLTAENTASSSTRPPTSRRALAVPEFRVVPSTSASARELPRLRGDHPRRLPAAAQTPELPTTSQPTPATSWRCRGAGRATSGSCRRSRRPSGTSQRGRRSHGRRPVRVTTRAPSASLRSSPSACSAARARHHRRRGRRVRRALLRAQLPSPSTRSSTREGRRIGRAAVRSPAISERSRS